MTLTLIRWSSISNSSELFSYATMYSDFVFLDRFLFELSCKNTHTHTQTRTHTHTHTDSNEYPIVAFSKNATIKRSTLQLILKIDKISYVTAKFGECRPINNLIIGILYRLYHTRISANFQPKFHLEWNIAFFCLIK